MTLCKPLIDIVNMIIFLIFIIAYLYKYNFVGTF